jgi:cell division protein ZapA
MTNLMEEKKQSVKVNIFGEDYPIKGDSEAFYIQEVANYVDLKMKEVAERMSNKLPLRVAVLAAMSITDELFKEKEEREKKLKDVEVRSRSLLDLLDKRLSQEES